MQKANYKDPLGNINFEYDYLAIKWLNLNLKGSPIISEGNTPLYRWGNRISVYTGLPTIIGWDWHQTQQRKNYEKEIQIRKNDLKLIYSSSDLKTSLNLSQSSYCIDNEEKWDCKTCDKTNKLHFIIEKKGTRVLI